MENNEIFTKMLKAIVENTHLLKAISMQFTELLTTTKTVLDTQEACQFLNIKPRKLSELRKTYKFNVAKSGKKYYYLRENLEQYIRNLMAGEEGEK